MKKLFAIMALTALLATTAYAEPQLNRRNVWNAKQIFRYGFDDQVARYKDLPIAAFTLEGTEITASTTPGLESDDSMTNIVWADGETSPAQITFRVPADYDKNGVFKLFVSESNSTTPNQVDFAVYINKADNSTAADSSATNQTPVALIGTTPETVTLTPATDFATLKAGDWVTFNVWRDDVAIGNGDLELKGVVFQYE